MAKLLEYNATLAERIDLTDALSIFRVKPDQMPAERPWFVPGQYCVLGMNNAEKPELGSVRRSMSRACTISKAWRATKFSFKRRLTAAAQPIREVLKSPIPRGSIPSIAQPFARISCTGSVDRSSSLLAMVARTIS